MKTSEKTAEKIRGELLRNLNNEVEERFDGNKTRVAEIIGMQRNQFTNVCNNKVGTTIEKLIQIGVRLGWKIELRVYRIKGDRR